MQSTSIKQIVILGGGTAGWMCAAALSRMIECAGVQVTLIESEYIGTVGVGEATIPSFLDFNRMLGISEVELMQATKATFKLGIEFVNWQAQGSTYLHPFGRYGHDVQGIQFYQLWLRAKSLARQNGCADPGTINDYNLTAQAAYLHRAPRSLGTDAKIHQGLGYAYHMDAGLYAKYLRDYSETLGVKRIEGIVSSVRQNPDSGFIEEVVLVNGTHICGELFVDCSGFRGLLIEQTLNAGYEDWSHWLPCDSAVTVASAHQEKALLLPYTRSIAEVAGWRWRIPLQHRIGNGYVYSSTYINNGDAEAILLNNLDAEPLSSPKRLTFCAGHRKRFWDKNCIAIGLAGGFIEPLESTSIHLIQSGIAKLLALFPDKHVSPHLIAEYNHALTQEYESIRDFIILHYKVNERNDSDFWRYLRDMQIPTSLERKMVLFKEHGRLLNWEYQLFTQDSWLAVMLGQGIFPRAHDPLAESLPLTETINYLAHVKGTIASAVKTLPLHGLVRSP